jgi:hypothetical protein
VSKNPFLVEILLKSKLWKLLFKQNREFRLRKIEAVSMVYSIVLDDVMQTFSFEMGVDMDNNQTPFGLYWKAVNAKAVSKISAATNFTKKVTKLSHSDKNSQQEIYNFFTNINSTPNLPFYAKDFFTDLGEYKQNWDFSSEEGVFIFKKNYNDILDKKYFWGYVDNPEMFDFWDQVLPLIDMTKNKSKVSKVNPTERSQNEKLESQPVVKKEMVEDKPQLAGQGHVEDRDVKIMEPVSLKDNKKNNDSIQGKSK